MSVFERGPRKENRAIAVGDRVQQYGRGKLTKGGTVVELSGSLSAFHPVPRVKVQWDGVVRFVERWPIDFLVVVADKDDREDA